MKIHPVGAQLFHLDRQTDLTKLTVAFHIFANTQKMIRFGRRFQIVLVSQHTPSITTHTVTFI